LRNSDFIAEPRKGQVEVPLCQVAINFALTIAPGEIVRRQRGDRPVARAIHWTITSGASNHAICLSEHY
jgi:hypothetical protein